MKINDRVLFVRWNRKAHAEPEAAIVASLDTSPPLTASLMVIDLCGNPRSECGVLVVSSASELKVGENCCYAD